MSPFRARLPFVSLAVLFVVPFVCNISTLIDDTIYASLAILALSLALVWGAGGILSLGQAAFFGVGGYAYAVTAINCGSPIIAVCAAVAAPMILAAFIGYVIFWGRVSDAHVAVITLTVTQIFQHFLNQTGGSQWHIGAAALGGSNGFPGVPLLNWPPGGDEPASPLQLYIVTMTALIIVYGGCRILLASRFGRVLVAIRQNEVRAGLLGYNVRLHKQLAFVGGGGIAGLAGALFGNTVLIGPQMFGLNISAEIIIFVIAGGAGTLAGPVVASFVIQTLAAALGTAGQIDGFHWIDPNLALGFVFVVCVIFFPGGLFPFLGIIGNRLLGRLARQFSAAAPLTKLGERDA